LRAFPGLPHDAQGPVFAEPWQAQAFALVLRLHAQGAFAWGEWAEALTCARNAEPDADGSRYFEDWVTALERVITARGLLSATDLAARKAAWAQAYLVETDLPTAQARSQLVLSSTAGWKPGDVTQYWWAIVGGPGNLGGWIPPNAIAAALQIFTTSPFYSDSLLTIPEKTSEKNAAQLTSTGWTLTTTQAESLQAIP
jgi:nitrile hydratase accessory protein